MSAAAIDVLVVEDSQVMRMLLVHLLESEPRFRVIGAVDSGPAALAFIEDQAPDVVLMDIHMEGMDGFEVTRRIMETQPLPIVMCSAISNPREVATVFRVLEAGAVAIVEKPVASDHPHFARLSRELLDTVRLMSEVKVIRRWPRHGARAMPGDSPETPPRIRGQGAMIVAIGASTGGPPALQAILAGLQKDFPFPILVVQHITAGFLPGLAEWLSQTTALQVQIASHGVRPMAGHVYLAPDDFHMEVDARGDIGLARTAPVNGLRPAVDHLFRSAATHCGPNAVAVLLTGMGKDGAAAMKVIRDCGGKTIAQDRETSVVHGMPGAAIALDAAGEVLPIDQIGGALRRIAEQHKYRKTNVAR